MSVTVKIARADGQEDKILEIIETLAGEPVVATIALMVGEETKFHLSGNKEFLLKEREALDEVTPNIDEPSKAAGDQDPLERRSRRRRADVPAHQRRISDRDPSVGQGEDVETPGIDDSPEEVKR